jgi:hypothetical protein
MHPRTAIDLPGHLQFTFQTPQFLFLWRLMPTADTCLLSVIRKFLAPVLQRAIGNAHLARYLRLGFSTPLEQLHRFQFAFPGTDPLFFWQTALPLETLFQVYPFRESRSRPYLASSILAYL